MNRKIVKECYNIINFSRKRMIFLDRKKENEVPTKKKFAWILVYNYAILNIMLLFLIPIFLLLLAISVRFILEENIFNDFSLYSTYILIGAYVFGFISVLFQKKARPKNFKFLIGLIVFCLLTNLIWLLLFKFLFNDVYFINILIQFLLILIFGFALLFRLVYIYANSTYELFKNKKPGTESYDILEKSEFNFAKKEWIVKIYQLKCLLYFAIFMLVVFGGFLLLLQWNYGIISIPEEVLNLLFMSAFLYYFLSTLVFVVLEGIGIKLSHVKYPNIMIYSILITSLILSFLKSGNEDIDNSFKLAMLLVSYQSIFFIAYYFMKDSWKNENILNHYKSKIAEDEDLILIDEPVDSIEHLQQNCAMHLENLHNVFEINTKAPMNIALTGNWGGGKSSVAKTLGRQLSKINKYSFEPLNNGDRFKERYFVINIDLLKFDSPAEINNYIHEYIDTLCKIFLVQNRKNVELYLDKILELVADIAPKSISGISKIIKKIGNQRFQTMEELKENFQKTLMGLFKRSNRQGIILIVDDIDRLPKDNSERKKIYNFLKEFYNIYGLKVLLIRGHGEEEILSSTRKEMQKFINVEYSFKENEGLGIKDEYFNKIIRLAAKSLSQKLNAWNYEEMFNLFDYKFSSVVEENHISFHDFLNKILIKYCKHLGVIEYELEYLGGPILENIDSFCLKSYEMTEGSYSDALSHINLFLRFLNDKSNNPRSYKEIFRKALLERSSIFKYLIEDYRFYLSTSEIKPIRIGSGRYSYAILPNLADTKKALIEMFSLLKEENIEE